MGWFRSLCVLTALCWSASVAAQSQPASPSPTAPQPAAPDAPAKAKKKPAAAKQKPPAVAPKNKPAAAAPAAPDAAQPGSTAPTPSAEPGSTPDAGAAAAPPAASEAAPMTEPSAEGAAAPPAEAGEATPAEAQPETEPEPAPAETAPPALPGAPPAPEQSIPSPGEMEQMLNEQLPPPQPSSEFTAPTPVLTLHGYLRARGELMDTFWLGRDTLLNLEDNRDLTSAQKSGQGPDPFSRFRPAERRPATSDYKGSVSCKNEGTKSDGCDVSTLQFANMRLRLSPELALSEDVRVKATFDVLDNVVLGEPPASLYGTGPGSLAVFTGTDLPPNEGTGLGDSIKARRAWAEVRNRDLGELRFGRMPEQWGLGMYYNAGNGIDDDVSTDVDRVLGITKLAGLYLSAAYDFAAEGLFDATSPDDRPIDQSQLDDLDQFTFSVARRNSPEELTAAREKGELVLNGGLQLQLRHQDAKYELPPAVADPADPMMVVTPEQAQAMGARGTISRVGATTYTSDLWAMLRYRGLRIEAEGVWVTGGMDNVVTDSGRYDINEFGYALETELRLVDDKLGLYFDHGLATGDSDVEGLSSDSDFVTQLGDGNRGNGTISTFRFHPSYRVDLILWRNIMQQVTGAYYFKPGIGYDFIRNDFGQLFGARLDVIWSRASSFVQTWGNDPNLGVEIDVSLYYRTEDGPAIDDGYYAKLQYGALFPMRGLAFRHEDTDLSTAQTLRLLLGVAF